MAIVCSVVLAPPVASAVQVAKLTAADGAASNYLGYAVAVDGQTAVAGAWGASAAYVFTRAGGTWSQQAKLAASDAAPGFGYAVAVDGDTAVAGAHTTSAAYVFTRSGTTWTQQAKLTPFDPTDNDQFGNAVAVSGDTVVVGKRYDDGPAGNESGSAYVFTRSGSTWALQAKLTAADPGAADEFGYSVSISGDTLVVGALSDDTPAGGNAGSAYVFTRSGTTWTQQAKLTAGNASPGDGLGTSVAVSGDTAVAGAPSAGFGAAYVFTRSGTVWSQQARLSDAGSVGGDAFATSVAATGDRVVAGAPGDDTGRGSVYAFERSGTSWTSHARYSASDAGAADALGVSVGVDGETIVAGAWRDDLPSRTDAGSAYVFSFDITPPQTTVDSSPPSLTESVDATLTFSASEPSTFTCSLDAAPPTPCTSPQTYTGLADGDHNFSVRATDAAGNVDPSPANYGWTVDTTPPQTTIDSAPSGIVASDQATIDFSANEPAFFTCSLDGAPSQLCLPPVDYVSLGEGPHTFSVYATDLIYNADPSPATRTWTVDTTPPQTVIDSGPSGTVPGGDATIGFSSDEPSTFICSLDAAPALVCTSPATYPGLGDGTHTFSVRATDVAGNADPSPATRTWTVDATPPETTIDSGPSGTVATGDANIGFSADEPSTFACSLDGAPPTDCTPPATYAGLTDGPHTFSVRATDLVGNADPSPATRTWTVDTTGPELTVQTGDGDILLVVPPISDDHVNGSASDPAGVARIDVTFTGTTPLAPTVQTSVTCHSEDCAWGARPPAFPGRYDVLVTATDAVGNATSAAPFSIIVIGAGAG